MELGLGDRQGTTTQTPQKPPAMADNNTTPTAANDRTVASTPGTRRTSTSSAGNMADQPQATRDQSNEGARKPRPRPVDYGGSLFALHLCIHELSSNP